MAALASAPKYKFHPEYLQNAAGSQPGEHQSRRSGSSHSLDKSEEPQAIDPRSSSHEDDDFYWFKRYRLVNYRKQYPNDFKEDEFKLLHSWVTDGETSTIHCSGDLLFGKIKPFFARRRAKTPPFDPLPSEPERQPIQRPQIQRRSLPQQQVRRRASAAPTAGEQTNLFNTFSFKRIS